MQPDYPLQLIFRTRLQSLLQQHGLSQRQLALAIHVRPQSVNNYLRGVTRLPGAQELLALARFFGVPMEHFLTDRPGEMSASGDGNQPGALPGPPVFPAAAVRRAGEQMRRCAEELRREAQRLEASAGGEGG